METPLTLRTPPSPDLRSSVPLLAPAKLTRVAGDSRGFLVSLVLILAACSCADAQQPSPPVPGQQPPAQEQQPSNPPPGAGGKTPPGGAGQTPGAAGPNEPSQAGAQAPSAGGSIALDLTSALQRARDYNQQ